MSPAAAPSRATPAIRLEMLVERVAKLHAQIGQGVLVARSQRALAAALREFERGLREVSARAPDAEARDNYALLGLLWSEYRDWAGRPASRDNARRLRERAEEAAWIAAKGARMVQAGARATANASAVRAATAGVLSQRAAKDHLWIRWGLGDAALEREARESQENLARILESLHAAPQARAEIAGELQAAESQLAFLLDGARELGQRGGAARALEFVAKAADGLLEASERLVALYEAEPG